MEEWRAVPGFENYEVSSKGAVRRCLKPKTKRSGHLEVQLHDGRGGYKSIQVHRLVLLTFVGPPPPGRPFGIHGDGDPANNDLNNLRWASPKENSADQLRHGRRPRGWFAGPRRFSEHDVREIRALARDGLSQEKIAKKKGTSQSHIGRILRGELWSWVK